MTWKKKDRPNCLEKRFEFECYDSTRDFLDSLGNFCEKIGRYPDISFGKTYVNLTVRPETETISDEEYLDDNIFTKAIDELNS